MEKWNTIKVEFLKVAKAVVAFVVPGLVLIATLLVGDQTLGDLNTLQWILVAVAVLGTPIGVYYTPNKP